VTVTLKISTTNPISSKTVTLHSEKQSLSYSPESIQAANNATKYSIEATVVDSSGLVVD